MSLRPLPARWLEVLVPRSDCAMALELMARTGTVELEARAPGDMQGDMPGNMLGERLASAPECRAGLDELLSLARQYEAYWPRMKYHPAPLPGSPRHAIERALARIRTWEHEALPLIRQLQSMENERAELRTWRDLFAALGNSSLDFGLLSNAGPVLCAQAILLPADAEIELPHDILVRRCFLGEQQCLLSLGSTEQGADIGRRARSLKGRYLTIPKWLQGRAEDNLYAVALRLAAMNQEITELAAEVQRVGGRYSLGKALDDVRRIEWLITQISELPSSDHFVLITGWTNDLSGRRLVSALRHAGLRFLLSFPPPPENSAPPLLLRNPWWARPFEVFSRALGMPGLCEADPSQLLAFVVPLLFGYMFADVGQGLVLFAAGWRLRKRWPLARLLMVGGLASAAFGLLFGSMFGREDWIPALWMHPLADPLTILIVPLYAGAMLLVLGMALRGLQSYWRGMAHEWLSTEAGLLLLYVGLLAAVLEPAAALLGLVGIPWYVVGHTRRKGGMGHLFAGLASVLDEAIRLGINTLSFARVGAFALAHAGLSAAMVSLADAVPGAGLIGVALAGLVMLVGNAVVLALEGLVVSVQTTRLILLEFFMRFLGGGGRVFRPLRTPDVYPLGGELYEPTTR